MKSILSSKTHGLIMKLTLKRQLQAYVLESDDSMIKECIKKAIAERELHNSDRVRQPRLSPFCVLLYYHTQRSF